MSPSPRNAAAAWLESPLAREREAGPMQRQLHERLKRAILDGTQPADLTLDHLMAKPLPAEWGAQRQLFDHI